MKLLFTQDTDWLRRNPAQQHHLAEMLSLRGHEVRVIDHELLWRTEGRGELYSRREIFKNISKKILKKLNFSKFSQIMEVLHA